MPAELRKISLAPAIIFSFLTLGIYFLVLTYKNSKDIHEGRPGGKDSWKVLFWLGFITFGITWIVLLIFNMIRVGELRETVDADNTMGIVALVLYFLTLLVGAILWTIHWNETVDKLEAAGAVVPPQAVA